MITNLFCLINNSVMLKPTIVLLAAACIACGFQYDGLRVKFGWSQSMAEQTHFFTVPRLADHAEELGWTRYEPPESHLPDVKMFCTKRRQLCPLYDSSGFIVGVQVAMVQDKFFAKRTSPGKILKEWNPRKANVHGFQAIIDTHWAATQYFVSEESLKAGAGPTVENGQTLQDGGVWVTGLDKELIRIPTTEAEINSTLFKKQNCVPNKGTHYFYNMTEDLDCERMVPWFALVSAGQLVGTGFHLFGVLDNVHDSVSERLFEEAAGARAKITVPNGPPCYYDLARTEGLLYMHIYYIDKPWTVACRDGDSVKPAPFLDRLWLNSQRYYETITDQFKQIFSMDW